MTFPRSLNFKLPFFPFQFLLTPISVIALIPIKRLYFLSSRNRITQMNRGYQLARITNRICNEVGSHNSVRFHLAPNNLTFPFKIWKKTIKQNLKRHSYIFKPEASLFLIFVSYIKHLTFLVLKLNSQVFMLSENISHRKSMGMMQISSS